MHKSKHRHHAVQTVLLVLVLAKTYDAAPVPADVPQKQWPVAKPPPGGLYTTRYDHIDVENILNNKRLVYYYAECLLDRGPCTPQGIEFKRILPEALRTNCLYCTPKQRFVTYKSIRRLRKEYPDVWGQLSALWDPTEEYYFQLEQSVIDDKSTNVQIPQKKQQHAPSTTSGSNIQKIPNSGAPAPIELVIRTTTPSTTTSYRPSTYPQATSHSGPAAPNINAALHLNDNINAINVEGQSSDDAVFLADRFGSSSEVLPSKPEAAFPGAASSTTVRSISTDSSKNDVSSSTSPASPSVYDVPVIITSKPSGDVLPTITTVKRINISIDGRPFSRPPGTIPTPINNLILGTNQILGSLTDIASKVIVTGNNLAGMVLNTVQNVLVG